MSSRSCASWPSVPVNDPALDLKRMRQLLLCPPDYYGIEYEINPWMSKDRAADNPLVQAQWKGLFDTLSKLNCKVELVPPPPKLPDMVFTANAGLTVDRR